MSDQLTADSVVYKDIPGFPGYRVGSDGTIWTNKCRNRRGVYQREWVQRVTQPNNDALYLCVNLFVDRKTVRVKVARLVLLAFVGPCPPGMECCHGDGNPKNDALANLRWDTRLGNNRDRRRHGTIPRGEKVGGAKLTAEQVKGIRGLRAGGMSLLAIAAKFNVSAGTVSEVARRGTWKHVA